MEYRILGNTGLRVSAIGLGATQIGSLEVSVKTADEVLKTALDSGINFIDTAPRYFESETRIGNCLGQRADEYIVATKCGAYRIRENGDGETRYLGGSDYTRQGILDTIDRSRRALKKEIIDIVQFHGPPKPDFDEQEAFEALIEARESGRARFVGLSAAVDGETSPQLAQHWPLDTYELNYNLLWQEPGAGTIPRLAALGRGIIAKRPFANAVFLGSMVDDGADANAMRERLKRFPLSRLASEYGYSLQELALRFTLSHPQVATAIVGTADPRHVAENAAVADGKLLSAELLGELGRWYRQATDAET